VAFFVSRARDVRLGKAADLKAARRGEQLTIADPTTLSSSELYGAMAIRPLDEEALRARAKVWDTERQGMRSGGLIVVLIFLCVPPIYFFHTFIPTLIGAAVIGTWGIWKSFQLMGPAMGGVYEMTDQVMAPLGLRVTEHYDIAIEPSLARGGGPAPATRGALTMEGERHSRQVKIRTPASSGRSTRTVEVSTDAGATFELRVRDGLFHAVGAAPAAVTDVIAGLSRSSAWKGVRAEGRQDRIVVRHKAAGPSDPMLDLWLAERLADALDQRCAGS
jgi:hypothetical protein